MSRTGGIDRSDFRIDIGRAGKGETFVRVIHIPSGKQRIKVGLGIATTQDIANQMIEELSREVNASVGREGDATEHNED